MSIGQDFRCPGDRDEGAVIHTEPVRAKGVDMPTGGCCTRSTVARLINSFFRVAIASNLITMGIIFAGMPRNEPIVVPPATASAAPAAAEDPGPNFRETLFAGIRRGAIGIVQPRLG